MSVHQTEPWVGEAVSAPVSPARWMPAIAVALCALFAIAIQSLWLPIDADVSWLITVSERMLGGARLYGDIVEVNPPASVWLYLPLVWVAQAIDVRPEAVVAAGFVAGGIASTLCTVKLASRLDDAPNPILLACAAGLVTLVFPMALFAQREHAALLLALPALTALALIAEGKPLRSNVSIMTGFAAGLVIVIKPHFALAILPAAAWAVWRRRSLKPLLPGLAAACVAQGLYAAAVLLWARPYFAWLPTFSHTYLPFHRPLWNVLSDPLLFPALTLLPAFLLRPKRLSPLAVTAGIGAIGFAVAAMVQAKDYPNHLFPGAALALTAALTILGSTEAPRERRVLVSAILTFACIWQMRGWIIQPDPKIAAAVTQVAPPKPKIIALSRELMTGHPLTRNIGGTWVGSRAGLYVAGLAHDQGLRDPIAAEGYRQDLHGFAADVARNVPDVILVEREDKSWLMRQPEIAVTMHGYRPAKRVGDTEIWVRTPDAR